MNVIGLAICQVVGELSWEGAIPIEGGRPSDHPS
jgi:hypothetical protein